MTIGGAGGAAESNGKPTGPVTFAQYAFPPNALGYCGPEDSASLLEYASTRTVDGGLVQLATRFSGAWPYLELIAGSVGRDPLDDEVVEAYWIGNALLERVHRPSFAMSLEDRFRSRLGKAWTHLSPAVPNGGRPHHSFHVFCVYPWVGLLRSGTVDEPLRVLDRCRIRWGQVSAVGEGRALVEYRPLHWNGAKLGYGPVDSEWVQTHANGSSLTESVAPGDTVACHWDWVCARIDRFAAMRLEHYTRQSLRLANSGALSLPDALT